MKVYAFDVDDTLEVSNGPVKLADLCELAHDNIIGLCGNWAMVTQLKNWHRVISFVGPMTMTKAEFLGQIKRYVSADDYVLVGNDDSDPKWRVNDYMPSTDALAAMQAGWRFISEDDFAGGRR